MYSTGPFRRKTEDRWIIRGPSICGKESDFTRTAASEEASKALTGGGGATRRLQVFVMTVFAERRRVGRRIHHVWRN